VPPFARRIALNQHSRHDLLASTGNWRRAVQAYLACITFSDAMLGRMLDALDRSPNRDNTIVALWSDHGYHLGEKWHWHKQLLESPGQAPAAIAR
jgi:arylsulfatase A-like enzyme